MTTKFLHDPGTNGFIVSPFELFNNTDAAFDTLANGNTVTSANGGTSGKFTQTNFGNAPWGLIWFVVGDVAWTPTAGGVLSCWWIHSGDNFSTSENTDSNVAIPRPPDFIIPFTAAALNTSDNIFAVGSGPNGTVELPWDTVKVYVQNNSGATMGNTTTTHAKMWCGPVADAY
jgi:hypothetical protein